MSKHDFRHAQARTMAIDSSAVRAFTMANNSTHRIAEVRVNSHGCIFIRVLDSLGKLVTCFRRTKPGGLEGASAYLCRNGYENRGDQ